MATGHVTSEEVVSPAGLRAVGSARLREPATAGCKATPRPVRALVVAADTYPPQRVDVSVLFGEELAGRGHQIDWILQSETACSRSHTVAWRGGSVLVGATDLRTSLLARIRKHCLGIANDLRVFAQLRKGDYDIVIAKDNFASGLFVLLAAKLCKRPFVYWLSYLFPESYLIRAQDGTAPYPLLYRIRGAFFWVALYRFLLPAADHVFVQSEQMRRHVNRQGIPLSRLTAVPMGVRGETAAQASDEPRQLIPAAQRCILYLGALGRERRLEFVIRVLALVREQIADARLYFVGAGDYPEDEQLLRSEAERLGLSDAVLFLGRMPQPQALRYVREADVCVSPLFRSTVFDSASPTKLVEYLAMGKAVVANDHPEQRLVLEQSGGGYCVPWDEGPFAAAIVQLLSDPERARQMGERGRRYVMEHRAYGAIADVVERELVALAGPRAA